MRPGETNYAERKRLAGTANFIYWRISWLTSNEQTWDLAKTCGMTNSFQQVVRSLRRTIHTVDLTSILYSHLYQTHVQSTWWQDMAGGRDGVAMYRIEWDEHNQPWIQSDVFIPKWVAKLQIKNSYSKRVQIVGRPNPARPSTMSSRLGWVNTRYLGSTRVRLVGPSGAHITYPLWCLNVEWTTVNDQKASMDGRFH